MTERPRVERLAPFAQGLPAHGVGGVAVGGLLDLVERGQDRDGEGGRGEARRPLSTLVSVMPDPVSPDA